MESRLNQTLRYCRTLRHLTASQIYWRLRYTVSTRRSGDCTVPKPLPPLDRAACERLREFTVYWGREVPPDTARTDDFLQGRFTFLNKTIQSTNPLWRGLDVSKLWQYHLHYFDFARDVALLYPEAGSPNAARVREWMLDWAAKNPSPESPGWDAYPLSVRLINWSLVLSVYGWDDSILRESMHAQLGFLRRHLEKDLRGNHLLKNAVALIVAGALLNSNHRNAGIALLRKEVRAQILPDGGHAERSPMYHGHVLIDLLVATAAMEKNPDWLSGPTQRAITYLHGVTHGDGCAAQFNDGAAEQAPTAKTALTLSEQFYFGLPAPKTSAGFPDTGHYRLAPGGDAGVFIVKAGKSTLDHQPGHAHSDLMSFEYSVGAQRIFVNSGTHGYAESPHRDYCRSIAAHNTVAATTQYQLEHWSTFRVGHRVHGEVHQWNPETPQLTASYGGGLHERSVQWHREGWWHIRDRVTYQGKHAIQAFFHLHPDGEANPIDLEGLSDGICACQVDVNGVSLTLMVAGVQEIQLVRGEQEPFQGWYFPRFGEAIPSTALVCHGCRSTYRSQLNTALVVDPSSALDAARYLGSVLQEDGGRP